MRPLSFEPTEADVTDEALLSLPGHQRATSDPVIVERAHTDRRRFHANSRINSDVCRLS